MVLSAVLRQILDLSLHILRAEDLWIYLLVISLLGLRDVLLVNTGYVCLIRMEKKIMVWLLYWKLNAQRVAC